MTKLSLNYKHTTAACCISYVTHAIINNIAPLLFIVFNESFNIDYEQLGRLVLLNFGVQIIADIIVAKYTDRVGYRILVVLAHIFAILGLVSLSVLPNILNNTYLAISIAIVLYALGGGTLEVLISPIVEAIPGEKKASSMSLLHSFYCWGQVIVVFVTTILLWIFGTTHWYILPLMWTIIPGINVFLFAKVPIASLVKDQSKTMSFRELLHNRHFRIAIVLMACAGASELTMSQWSSIFAQQGLQVNKVVGDLLGPGLFAILMGSVRLIYGIKGHHINIKKALMASSILCVLSYFITVFSRNPVFSLLGCAFCGATIALMWPGTISLTSARLPYGGTVLFGALAVMGDVGASLGPWITGFVSDGVRVISKPLKFLFGDNIILEEGKLKSGLLVAVIFPLIMLIVLLMNGKGKESKVD